MGFYIQGPATCKAQYIVSEYDGKIIPKPKSFEEVDSKKALVCVVDNGFFEAAGHCFSPKEFIEFSRPDDQRKKTWLVMNKELAEKLSGYKQKA